MVHSLIFDDQGRFIGRDVSLDQLRTFLAENHKLIWVDMEGATGEEAHNILGENLFNFHPLAINDCHEAISTPKIEPYEGVEPWRPCTFLVLHGAEYATQQETVQTSEMDAFIGKNFLVTWHEQPMKAIAQAFDRCVKTGPRGTDRLLHTIVDFLVESYQPALDALAAQIEGLQDQVFSQPTQATLTHIQAIRKQVALFRQIIGPQREVIGRLARGEFKMIRVHLLPYFRDVHDALVRISYTTDAHTDQLTNTLQVYLSHSSNQTNEVVKVLTILNAISIPALVVASVYGMNFKHMPELDWRFGYAFALALIVGSTVGLLYYLKRKNWF
jgi:magnesium transporter